ncbi:hypothetical protein PG630_01120 [Riemerella anatipestifer]|nr:hypothetical protein [Riemerella anatipestifer]
MAVEQQNFEIARGKGVYLTVLKPATLTTLQCGVWQRSTPKTPNEPSKTTVILTI